MTGAPTEQIETAVKLILQVRFRDARCISYIACMTYSCNRPFLTICGEVVVNDGWLCKEVLCFTNRVGGRLPESASTVVTGANRLAPLRVLVKGAGATSMPRAGGGANLLPKRRGIPTMNTILSQQQKANRPRL